MNRKKLFKVMFAVAVIGGAAFLRIQHVKPMVVPQNGMYPTIKSGRRFLIQRNPYKSIREIKRGDVVAFWLTENGTQFKFILRVIGLPGDEVQANGDRIILNGEELAYGTPKIKDQFEILTETNHDASYRISIDLSVANNVNETELTTVPEKHVFVMGDNRRIAKDSRAFGCIPFEAITNKKLF